MGKLGTAYSSYMEYLCTILILFHILFPLEYAPGPARQHPKCVLILDVVIIIEPTADVQPQLLSRCPPRLTM